MPVEKDRMIAHRPITLLCPHLRQIDKRLGRAKDDLTSEAESNPVVWRQAQRAIWQPAPHGVGADQDRPLVRWQMRDHAPARPEHPAQVARNRIDEIPRRNQFDRPQPGPCRDHRPGGETDRRRPGERGRIRLGTGVRHQSDGGEDVRRSVRIDEEILTRSRVAHDHHVNREAGGNDQRPKGEAGLGKPGSHHLEGLATDRVLFAEIEDPGFIHQRQPGLQRAEDIEQVVDVVTENRRQRQRKTQRLHRNRQVQ